MSCMSALSIYTFEFVIDLESSCLILSAKYSLINSAQQLPQDVSQVCPHSVVHVRYTALFLIVKYLTEKNIKRHACFVEDF